VNNSIGENSVNISNFLNNECINKYVTWYRLYNFLLDGRDADVIDLNYKKEWDVLFNKQIISGDYLKMSFLVRSATLFTEIVLRTSIQQELLFREYKRKLTRMVNVENSVRQASRANASEGEDHNFHNFFQIVISNTNSEKKNIFKQKYYNLEVRFVAYELFSEFIYTLYF